MALFRRTRRVNVGKFEPPKPLPEPPIDRVIDEGFMIALSAVRMAIKNGIILGALQQKRPYDVDAYGTLARREFEQLAAEHEKDAVRVADDYRAATRASGKAQHQHDYGAADRAKLRRRQQMHEGLASVLREFSTNDLQINGLVQEARDDAWHEFSTSTEAALLAREHPEPEHDDPVAKERRLSELRADLRLLATQSPPLPDY